MPGLLNTHDPAFIGGLLYGDINREWASGQATTTTTAVGSITLPSIPASRQHMILSHLLEGTGTAGARMTVNGESGALYAYTTSLNAGTDNQNMMSNFMTTTESTGASDTPSGDLFQIGFLGDDVANQKLIYTHAINSQGDSSGVTPRRLEIVGKANLLNQNLTRIDVNNVNTATQTFAANSNVSTCSIRQKPINQTPFWEQLDTSPGTNPINFRNLPNRRYYWLQAILKHAGTSGYWPYIDFNADTNFNYSFTRRDDFGGHTIMPGQNRIRLAPRQQSDPIYVNMWIANLSNRVKLFIGFINILNGGPSSATVPSSYEISGKWANTTAAINEMTIIDGGSGPFDQTASATVWGSRT